jgi:hypothetical protein
MTTSPTNEHIPPIEDAGARVSAYLKASRGRVQFLPVVVGIGGLFAAWVLTGLGEHHDWPEWLGAVFLGSGWVVMLGAWDLTARRERRLRERYQTNCPACEKPLLQQPGWNPLSAGKLARTAAALSSGSCPHCGSILSSDFI